MLPQGVDEVSVKASSQSRQSLAPAGGEAKQTEIATTEIPSYRNLLQSCMKNQLCYTWGKADVSI